MRVNGKEIKSQGDINEMKKSKTMPEKSFKVFLDERSLFDQVLAAEVKTWLKQWIEVEGQPSTRQICHAIQAEIGLDPERARRILKQLGLV